MAKYDVDAFRSDWWWENVQDADELVDTANAAAGVDPTSIDTNFASELGNFAANIRTSAVDFVQGLQDTVTAAVYELPAVAVKAVYTSVNFAANNLMM